jgi:hypothetical protein
MSDEVWYAVTSVLAKTVVEEQESQALSRWMRTDSSSASSSRWRRCERRRDHLAVPAIRARGVVSKGTVSVRPSLRPITARSAPRSGVPLGYGVEPFGLLRVDHALM